MKKRNNFTTDWHRLTQINIKSITNVNYTDWNAPSVRYTDHDHHDDMLSNFHHRLTVKA
jgi:hypothetical protein